MKNRLPKLYRILLTMCCLALVLPGCRSTEDSDGIAVATIKVTPSDTTMQTGEILQLTAEKLLTNSSTSDCSASATWTSSDTTVAGFSSTSNGLLSALAVGTTTIKVSCDGVSKSYTMTVTGAATLQAIEISPLNMAIAPSTSIILVATGVYSDGSTTDLTDIVNWSSNSPGNISVERSNGSNSIQATGQTAGSTATITAAYGGVSGTTSMAVKAATVTATNLYVTPVNPSLAVNARLFVKAAGYFSNDNSVQEVTDFATWSVSPATGIASVSSVNNGLTEGVAAGSATVTATFGGQSDNTVIAVGNATLESIEVYPKTLTLNLGTNAQLTAIGIYSDNTSIDITNQVTWNTSNSSIVGINTSHRYNVRLTALAKGNAIVAASLPNSAKGAGAAVTVSNKTLSAIEVTPGSPTVPVNLNVPFKAAGLFSDGSRQDLTDTVVWSSSDTAVLRMNNAFKIRGVARTLTSGTASVTASLGTISGSSTTTVSNSTLNSISVSPLAVDLPIGYRQQFEATGLYSDGSTQDLTPYVAWRANDTTKITVDNISPWQGVVTAKAAGSTNVFAYFHGADNQTTLLGSGSVDIDTTAATLSSIQISPTNPFCMEGFDISFQATGVFSDNTELDMTPFVVWKSSDSSISTANNVPGLNGKFHCVSSGDSTVTAASGSTSGTTNIYVIDQ